LLGTDLVRFSNLVTRLWRQDVVAPSHFVIHSRAQRPNGASRLCLAPIWL